MYCRLDKVIVVLKEWKEKIHFWFEDIETPMGKAFDITVVALVFVVSALFVIKTYNISDSLRAVLYIVESVIVAVFVIEYLLRFWSSPSKIKFFFNIYSIIDLVAIIPVFSAGGSYQILRVFRALRFLRLVRFLEGRHFFFKNVKPMHIIIIRIVYIVCAIIFVSAGLIFSVEHGLEGSKINSFFDALYFSVVTLTTVGYGDITPLSDYGRFITLLMITSGVIFIPWQIRDFIQQMVSPIDKIDKPCHSCGLRFHDSDAEYCKNCGSFIND